jgi:hypothetical protein
MSPDFSSARMHFAPAFAGCAALRAAVDMICTTIAITTTTTTTRSGWVSVRD